MKLTLKRTIITLFSALLVFCAMFTIIVNTNDKAHADQQVMSTTRLFLPSEIELSHSTVLLGSQSLQAGLKLTASKMGDSVELKNDYNGKFSYVIEPVLYENVINIKYFDTVFIDDQGKTFTVRLSYGVDSAYASLIVNGEEMGIYYGDTSWGKPVNNNNTTYFNSNSIYTSIPKTELNVIFDAETMTVSVGSVNSERLVWDLTKNVNDGREVDTTFSSFNNFSVKFVFANFNGENSAILIRKINDCVLDSLTLADSGTPVVCARFLEKGVINKKYFLPTALASDVWDGPLNVEYQVLSPNGTEVVVDNSMFIPNVTGNYIVKYTTENARGVEVVKDYILPVVATMPSLDNAVEESLFVEGETIDLLVGQTIRVPKMMLSGDFFMFGSKTATLTIKCRGVVVNGYNNVESGFDYKVMHSGLYEFIYDLGDGNTLIYKANAIQEKTSLVSDLKASYKINDVVDLRNAKLSVDGSFVDCEILVEYPDGRTYANNLFECSQIGKYLIFAEGKVGESTYAYSTEFSVYKNIEEMFTYNTNNISAGYGKSGFTGKSGLVIDYSGSSQEMTYSNVVDLSRYVNQTKTDSQDGTVTVSENAIPLISISIDPYAYGVASANNYYVELTDVNDPSNVMSIRISGHESPHASSITARAGEQDYVGFNNDEGRNGGHVIWNGEAGKFFRSGRYGFGVSASFYGYTVRNGAEESCVNLYYDNDSKQLLSNRCMHKNDIVCDFDDPVSYTGKPWKGFSADKAYITVKSGLVNADSCKIIVYSIDGLTFSNENLVYSEKPAITINKTQVYGLVGSEVKIPSAKAVDQFDQKLNVITKVYYEVDGESFDVKVKDGKFTAKSTEGCYYILYTAIDVYGNTSTKRLNVNLLDGAEELSANIISVPTEYAQGKTGSKIPLIPFSNLNIENAVGNIDYEWSVQGPNEVERQKDGFVAIQEGEYTVKLSLIDELGRIGYVSYTVVADAPDNPIAVSAPTYYGFVRGNVYKLVDVYAVDYRIGTEAKKADVWINGELNASGEFSAQHLSEKENDIEKDEKVLIEYKIGNDLVYYDNQPLSFEVPIKTVYKTTKITTGLIEKELESFLLERFFVLENGMVLDNDNTSVVAFETAQSGATAKFVQPISSKALNFTFDIGNVKNTNLKPIERTLSYVKVYVTDYLDCRKQITIEFYYDQTNDITKVKVNGIEAGGATFDGLFNGTMASAVSITYDATNNALLEKSKGVQLAQISTYNDYSDFEGFSDRVYLSFEVGVVSGKVGGIQISNINGQAFPKSGVVDDIYAPQVVLNGICGGMYSVGDKATIPSVTAFDVLSDVKDVTVTVTKDGQVVSDVNGTPLSNVSAFNEYVIELSMSGAYNVRYSASDSRKGVLTGREYVLTVRINEKPVIADVIIEPTIKVGKKLEIPIPEVSFAEESADNIFYIVYVAPDNTFQWFVEGDEAIATMVGTYRIRYMAIDAYGNTTYKEYKVECR